jgi:hypothetical protein
LTEQFATTTRFASMKRAIPSMWPPVSSPEMGPSAQTTFVTPNQFFRSTSASALLAGHAEDVADFDRDRVVVGVGNVSERAAPGVELPVLDPHLAVLNHVDGTVVPHPGVLVRNGMPDDVRMVGVAAGDGNGVAGLVSDAVGVVENVKRLILGDDVGDLGVGRLVRLLPATGPLQPDGLVKLEFRRDPTDGLGGGRAGSGESDQDRGPAGTARAEGDHGCLDG